LFDKFRRAHGLRALITIDETLAQFRHRGESGVAPVFIPEPSELEFRITQTGARRELGIPDDGEYVLLYGHLNMAKGVLELIRAVECMERERRPKILVLGHLAPEVRRCLERDGSVLRERGQLFIHDGFASLRSEALAFSAADVVWVGYSRHYGPSSVLGKATTARRPVVGCREGVIGWTIDRYGLGVAVDVRNTTAVKNALHQTLTDSSRAILCENIERYAQQREKIDFGRSVVDLIEEAADRRRAGGGESSAMAARTL
jgi:hypothetical protein